MTVCIAALATSDNCFVTVSDRRLFYSEDLAASDDAAQKLERLLGDWHVLFSGDVSNAIAIIKEARTRLYPFDKKLTFEVVQRTVVAAYRSVRSQDYVDRYLAQYGYSSIEDFRSKGLAELGSELFEKELSAIADFNLGVDLIVLGYEDMIYVQTADFMRFRHLFVVTNPGVAENREVDGFAVIGSGYSPALSALSVPIGLRANTVRDLVYLICEAKFLAEGSLGVGPATDVQIFGPNGKSVSLPESTIEKLRSIWKERQKEPVPDDVYWLLKDEFKKVDPFENE